MHVSTIHTLGASSSAAESTCRRCSLKAGVDPVRVPCQLQEGANLVLQKCPVGEILGPATQHSLENQINARADLQPSVICATNVKLLIGQHLV
jgi:hypothetical protein